MGDRNLLSPEGGGSKAAENNRDRGNWLWGLAGSDFNFILYCLTLYKLKRTVPAADYNDFRVIWWFVASTIVLTITLLSGIQDWGFAVIVVKWLGVAIAIPTFIVVQKASLNGFVIQKFFGGINTKNLYRLLFGIVLCGSCAVFLLYIPYHGTWQSILALTGINGLALALGFLVRNIRVALSEKS